MRGPRENPKGTQLEERGEGNLGPLPILRPELEHFLEMPMTSWGTRDRQGFPPEPSIKDFEQWLEWQACQLDTSHWWEELTAILGAEDIKKLVQKIHTSFNIPAVWYKVLRSQGYTAPPAPKCLKRGMFLLDDQPYQDIQLKPQQVPWPTCRHFNTGWRKPICWHLVNLALWWWVWES